MRIGELVRMDVVSVGPTHSLAEAAARMTGRNVGSIVVLNEIGPGILTERDILRAVSDGKDLGQTSVESYMTWSPVTATPAWDLRKAMRTMLEGGFRHLIVMGDDGQTGILSIRDLSHGLLEELEGEVAVPERLSR